jgi:hypothetical protein
VWIIDGANLGAEDTAAAYSVVWDTTAIANGSHTLTALARDAAGNTKTSAPVAVTVNNASSGSSWPNEPSGMTLLSDWGLDQQPPFSGDVPIVGAGGWKIVSQAAPGSARGWAERVTDAGAPFARNVYDFVYPSGMIGVTRPRRVFNGINRNEVYVGFWWSPRRRSTRSRRQDCVHLQRRRRRRTTVLILKPDRKLRAAGISGRLSMRDPNVNATTVSHRHLAPHRVVCECRDRHDDVLDGRRAPGQLHGRCGTRSSSTCSSSARHGRQHGALKRADHYWFDHVHLSAR